MNDGAAGANLPPFRVLENPDRPAFQDAPGA
ncbi:hypothetical protein SPH9361_03022 [Sphingobium sp. CECT 9361]|nr:hypothetical protein SPH9361_03022 [Sphingobium sp. CECT 9361]